MDRGCDVAAAEALTSRHPNGKIYHTKCVVSDASSVENLGKFAQKYVGTKNVIVN